MSYGMLTIEDPNQGQVYYGECDDFEAGAIFRDYKKDYPKAEGYFEQNGKVVMKFGGKGSARSESWSTREKRLKKGGFTRYGTGIWAGNVYRHPEDTQAQYDEAIRRRPSLASVRHPRSTPKVQVERGQDFEWRVKTPGQWYLFDNKADALRHARALRDGRRPSANALGPMSPKAKTAWHGLVRDVMKSAKTAAYHAPGKTVNYPRLPAGRNHQHGPGPRRCPKCGV